MYENKLESGMQPTTASVRIRLEQKWLLVENLSSDLTDKLLHDWETAPFFIYCNFFECFHVCIPFNKRVSRTRTVRKEQSYPVKANIFYLLRFYCSRVIL